MTRPLLVILAGSKADETHYQAIAKSGELFGLEVVIRIGSAHKTPEHVLSILKQYEADPRPKVYITVAGRSNALSGFTDGNVTAPVIACPPLRETYAQVDIFSSLRMPSGIAPATVLDPHNAAFLSAKILALQSNDVLQKIKEYQHKQQQILLTADKEYTSHGENA